MTAHTSEIVDPGPRARAVPLGKRVRRAIDSGTPQVAVIVEPNAQALARWSLPDSLVGAESYVQTLASAISGLACLAKIQPAAFERFGPDGMVTLARSIQYLQSAGTAVVLDSKRADHAPVLRELVGTYVGPTSGYRANGMSLLPYLGIGEITQVAGECADRGGLLVVVLQTSNAGASIVQHAVGKDGSPVTRMLAEQISAHNARAGRDEVAAVLGGPPELAAELLEGFEGLAVLPGWGRPSVDRAALREARAVNPEQVLISIGSYLTNNAEGVKETRDLLCREIEQIEA